MRLAWDPIFVQWGSGLANKVEDKASYDQHLRYKLKQQLIMKILFFPDSRVELNLTVSIMQIRNSINLLTCKDFCSEISIIRQPHVI